MESAMRRRLGQRVWKAILWLLLFSLAGTSFIGILYQVFGSGKDQFVLQVNGIKISRADLAYQTQSLQETIHMIRTQAGQYADFILQQNGLLGQPQVLALDRLVARAVALDGARKSGMRYISPRYAADKLDDPNFVLTRLNDILPTYLLQGYGRLNRQALDEFFRRSPGQAARFDAQYESILQEDLFNQVVEGIAYVPMSSLIWRDRLAQSTRFYATYTLSKEVFLKKAQAEESKEVLTEFFKQENLHRRYWTDEARAGVVWRFSPEKYGVTVSEVALRRYFADHAKTEFKDKTFEAVKKEIQERLLKDQFKKLFSIEAKSFTSANTAEGFAQFVEKKHGVSTKLASTKKSDASTPVLRALFSIIRQGSRAFLIDEDGSGVIVELTHLDQSREQSFEEVSGEVRSDWLDMQANQKLAAAAEEVLQNLRDEKKLQELLKQYQVKIGATIEVESNNWEKVEKEKLPVAQMKLMGHVDYGVIFSPDQNTLKIVSLQKIVFDETQADSSGVAAQQADTQSLRIMKMVLAKDVLAVLKDSAKIKQYKEEKTTDISSYFAE